MCTISFIFLGGGDMVSLHVLFFFLLGGGGSKLTLYLLYTFWGVEGVTSGLNIIFFLFFWGGGGGSGGSDT